MAHVRRHPSRRQESARGGQAAPHYVDLERSLDHEIGAFDLSSSAPASPGPQDVLSLVPSVALANLLGTERVASAISLGQWQFEDVPALPQMQTLMPTSQLQTAQLASSMDAVSPSPGSARSLVSTPTTILTPEISLALPVPMLKALPTVRDHTTGQLNEQGDEYIVRQIDQEGEKKVAPNGALQGRREYRCRTFLVLNRGDKLFMLATECTKVLGYRDSYLLFNKNRSLHKIIANQDEKDDLITQGILLSSYRSRQIAIVTARSMFRQFGSRLIVDGRRVRDDYWEANARKQGFTEDDPAGEKRPGATKQREAAAVEQAYNATLISSMPQPDQTAMGEFGYTSGASFADIIASMKEDVSLDFEPSLACTTPGANVQVDNFTAMDGNHCNLNFGHWGCSFNPWI